MPATRRANDAGFTLVELLVVVLVLAVLAGVGIPVFVGARARTADRTAEANVNNVRLAAARLAMAGGGFAQVTPSALAGSTTGLTVVDGATASTGPQTVSVSGSATGFVAVARGSSASTCVWMRVDGQGRVTRGSTTGGRCSAGAVLAAATLGTPVAPVLWLDGADLDGDGRPEGSAESGQTAGAVATWRDHSGSGCDATRPAASTAAPQLAVGPDGRQATVRFSLTGGPNFLTVSCPGVAGAAAASRTIIAVARANRTGGGSNEFAAGVAVWPGWHNGLWFSSPIGSTAINGVESCQWQAGFPGTTCAWRPADAGRYVLVSQVLTATAGSFTIQTTADGGTTTATSPLAPAAASADLVIGRSAPAVWTDWNSQLDGDIAELLVFDRALSPGERAPIEAALTAKWLTGSVALPAAGLEAWYDAADLDADGREEAGAEAGASGGVVSSWRDRSGQGRHLTQTGAARPAFVPGGLAGRPVVRFDGADDLLVSALSPVVTTGPATFVAVVRDNGTARTATSAGVITTTSGSPTADVCQGIRWTGPGAYGPDGCAGGFAAGAATAGVWRIVVVVYPGANQNGAQTFENGVARPTSTTSSALGASWNQLVVGSRTPGTGRVFRGDVAELRVYRRALPTAERVALQQALATKWGITLG